MYCSLNSLFCDVSAAFLVCIKALANEDTLLRTYCCRHKCFPVCPRTQHLLRTQILCPGRKKVSDFVQKHFVSATNVSQFAQPKKHHEQQCVLVCQYLKVPALVELKSQYSVCFYICVLIHKGREHCKKRQTR